MNELVLPLIERERERIDLTLFEEEDPTCKCCRHGKKKQMACWGCAGFEKAPSKAKMIEKIPGNTVGYTKTVLEAVLLSTCRVCEGKPRETRLRYNPNSGAQNKVVLYDVLKLPKKTKDGGKLTTDEQAIRSILGGIA